MIVNGVNYLSMDSDRLSFFFMISMDSNRLEFFRHPDDIETNIFDTQPRLGRNSLALFSSS
jgi:hypothetical protein